MKKILLWTLLITTSTFTENRRYKRFHQKSHSKDPKLQGDFSLWTCTSILFLTTFTGFHISQHSVCDKTILLS